MFECIQIISYRDNNVYENLGFLFAFFTYCLFAEMMIAYILSLSLSLSLCLYIFGVSRVPKIQPSNYQLSTIVYIYCYNITTTTITTTTTSSLSLSLSLLLYPLHPSIHMCVWWWALICWWWECSTSNIWPYKDKNRTTNYWYWGPSHYWIWKRERERERERHIEYNHHQLINESTYYPGCCCCWYMDGWRPPPIGRIPSFQQIKSSYCCCSF